MFSLKNISKCCMLKFLPSDKHQFSADGFSNIFFPRSLLIFHGKLCIICMKCHILFSGRNEKSVINMLSAEIAQSAKHQFTEDDIFKYYSQETRFDISCKLSLIEIVCTKCQILLAWKTKKNIIKYIVLWNCPAIEKMLKELQNYVCAEQLSEKKKKKKKKK